MIKLLLEKLSKPLSIVYIAKFLRNKGIATHERDNNNLGFKLYDMNWDLYFEEGRLGIKTSFNLGDNINTDYMLQATNKLNSDRWIVKAFIETYLPEKGDNSNAEDKVTSIVFSFENFCYSETDFEKIYEFAIYAMTDGIEFHRKSYAELINEKNTCSRNPIGFHKDQNNNSEVITSADGQKRNKIGFH